MLTSDQVKQLADCGNRIAAAGHLLQRGLDHENERQVLLLIGDESASLSKVVEQLLAPWNR